MKKYKTTKKEYEIFQKEFNRLIKLFGLIYYDITFTHKIDDNNYASITVDEESKRATVNFTTYLSRDELSDFNPKRIGRHEASHLLINRLGWLGEKRYATESEIDEEEEKIVRILAKVLNE